MRPAPPGGKGPTARTEPAAGSAHEGKKLQRGVFVCVLGRGRVSAGERTRRRDSRGTDHYGAYEWHVTGGHNPAPTVGGLGCREGWRWDHSFTCGWCQRKGLARQVSADPASSGHVVRLPTDIEPMPTAHRSVCWGPRASHPPPRATARVLIWRAGSVHCAAD